MTDGKRGSSGVPEGWRQKTGFNKLRTATIGDVCTFTSGKGFGPQDWSDTGLPIIRIQNLNGSRDFNYFAGVPQDHWIIEPGTLLFAWAGVKGVSFGPTLWGGPTGVLNQHIYKTMPREGIDKYWLYSALKVITAKIEGQAHGFKSSLLHVHKSDITKQPISIPPLEEQRKIAEILSTWDEAIEQQTRLLELKRERKRGLMQQLLTGKVRFKEFEGLEWNLVELGSLLSFLGNGLTYDTRQTSGVKVTRIETISVGVVDTSRVGYTAHTKAIERYRLRKGDLLYSHINSLSHIGKVAYFDSARLCTKFAEVS